jgi:formate dehydrogenase beta subunit
VRRDVIPIQPEQPEGGFVKRPLHQLKGRQVDAAARAEVLALIEHSRWGAETMGGVRRDLLIEYLHLLQDEYRALHDSHLAALADILRVGMAEVYEVATFYHHFDVLRDNERPARVTVRVCDGLSCELAGAQELLAKLPALLDARHPCAVHRALCAGPAVCVHQSVVAPADAQQVLAHDLLRKFKENRPLAHTECASPATKSIAFEDYQQQGGYALLKSVASGERSAERIIGELESSGLRGLGGAGFPAGRKWRIVREQPSPKLMAVNIDEGEPGTFKDRHYLERDPHRFLEGMLIAAQVVSIEAIYIYLRDEYHDCRVMLQAEIDKLVANPPSALPRIELRRGAGAYICGEESAMIESIEGKRGEPRMRPPYIAQVGLFGRPTLEHNFETLYWVREIVEKGADWFASQGRHGRKGLRSFSVSGRVKNPGVKLAPAGITLRELVDEYCGGMLDGHTLYAYLPGGASGGILPASLADVPLDFDTLQPYGCFIGSAAVIVLSQHDKARDAARSMMKFFAHESCGQCTPCRVGTDKAATLMEATAWDQATLEDLSTVMVDASICGLGQAAPNPMQSVFKYFAHEVTS